MTLFSPAPGVHYPTTSNGITVSVTPPTSWRPPSGLTTYVWLARTPSHATYSSNVLSYDSGYFISEVSFTATSSIPSLNITLPPGCDTTVYLYKLTTVETGSTTSALMESGSFEVVVSPPYSITPNHYTLPTYFTINNSLGTIYYSLVPYFSSATLYTSPFTSTSLGLVPPQSAVVYTWSYYDQQVSEPSHFTISYIPLVTAINTPEGIYDQPITTSLTTNISGSTIYYTLDGSDPTINSTTYSGILSISNTSTLKTFATLSGALDSSIVSTTYTFGTKSPTFSPSYGTYDLLTLPVTFSGLTPNSITYYTLDGSTPTSSSTTYTGTFNIDASLIGTTLQAISYTETYGYSTITSGFYYFECGPITNSIPSGDYDHTLSLALSASGTLPNPNIYYTLDGSDPDENSSLYTYPLEINSSCTLKVRAYKYSNYINYSEASYTYYLKVIDPTLSLAEAYYDTPQTILVATTTTGVLLYYTDDGTLPTQESALLSGIVSSEFGTYGYLNLINNGYTTFSIKAYSAQSIEPSNVVSSTYGLSKRLAYSYPTIYSGSLFFDSSNYFNIGMNSKYMISGNIDVQVSGTHGDYTTINGKESSAAFYHSLNLTFDPNNEWCDIAKSYSTRYGSVIVARYTTNNGLNVVTLGSVTCDSQNYTLRLVRTNNVIKFYYKLENDWELLTTYSVSYRDCSIGLDLFTNSAHSIIVNDVYFSNLIFNSGKIIYPKTTMNSYGIMTMDNIESDNSTIIPIYSIAIEGTTLYRLQAQAAYYGTNYTWSTYNYQVSTIRPFVDFVTVGIYPTILPATGRNVAKVTTIVKDQYGNGVLNKPVTIADDDTIGRVVSTPINTDLFYGTGKAVTSYMSGTESRIVTITATATQND